MPRRAHPSAAPVLPPPCSFSRSIRLPKGVDADGIAAKMADGVLTLTIPKAARQQPPSVSISVE